MNMIINAIDALELMGKNDSDCEEKPRIIISTKVIKTETVQIKISNNGPGISPEVQKQIFDPFFTTKPVGSGTG